MKDKEMDGWHLTASVLRKAFVYYTPVIDGQPCLFTPTLSASKTQWRMINQNDVFTHARYMIIRCLFSLQSCLKKVNKVNHIDLLCLKKTQNSLGDSTPEYSTSKVYSES
jgi:hypothetical protein